MQFILKRAAATGMKDQGDGHVLALFSRFNDVDKQGDLTLPGAFGEQRVLISGYGHASWNSGVDALPVGKGRIYETSEGAVMEGQFFDTAAGTETYKTVRAVGDLQEWSYALRDIVSHMEIRNGQKIRVIERVRVNEVSPVLLGAGNATRTISIKGCGLCGDACTCSDGGECSHPSSDGAEVLLAAKQALRASADVLARLELREIADTLDNRRLLRREIDRFEALRKRMPALPGEWVRAVSSGSVDPSVRSAAERALRPAWKALGAPWPVRIQWVRDESALERDLVRLFGERPASAKRAGRPVLGMAGSGGRVIYLNASNLRVDRAVEVVAHELKHLVQPSWLSHEQREVDSIAFALEFTRAYAA